MIRRGLESGAGVFGAVRDYIRRIMSLIAEQLPQLRRFARALTGSRLAGDACVGETLHLLIKRRRPMAEPDVRVHLYRTFVEVWLTEPPRRPGAPDGRRRAVDLRLQRLVPIERAAFLLSVMEGFDDREIASITGVPAAEIEAMVEKAVAELQSIPRTRVLIIEDEWLIAADLQRIVQSMGHVVVGLASRHDTAVLQANLVRPDLILADVKLDRIDGGLRAVRSILKSVNAPVVFVTGYPDLLLTGQESEPTFLVAKPFGEADLKAVIGQALFFGGDDAEPTRYS